MLRLARLARDNGGRVIVATVLPPFKPEWLRLPFWNESIRDFSQQANANLRAGEFGQGIELLDIARTLGGDDRHTPDIWGRNGLKLNAQGYAALTAEINRRLADPPAAPATVTSTQPDSPPK